MIIGLICISVNSDVEFFKKNSGSLVVFVNNLYASLAHFFCWYLPVIVNDIVIAAAAILDMCQVPCQCFLYFIYACETSTVNDTHFTVGESVF